VIQQAGANGIPASVLYAWEQFRKARKLISGLLVPNTDLYPDGVEVVNGLSVVTVSTSPAQTVQFLCDGYVVGIYATVRSGAAADLAGTLLRVQVMGNTDLFQLGPGGAGFMPFAQLQNTAPGGFRIIAPITAATPWNVYVQNTTSGTVVADISFAYCNTKTPPIVSD
jgi:hypothetical protein